MKYPKKKVRKVKATVKVWGVFDSKGLLFAQLTYPDRHAVYMGGDRTALFENVTVKQCSLSYLQ